MKKLFFALIIMVSVAANVNAQLTSVITDVSVMFQDSSSVKGDSINSIPTGNIVADCENRNSYGTKLPDVIGEIYGSWRVTGIKGQGNSTQFLIYHKVAGKMVYTLVDNGGVAPTCKIVNGQVVIQLTDNANMVYGDEYDGSLSTEVTSEFTIPEEDAESAISCR